MEQHSTALTEQQKRNMLVGTAEDQIISNQQQPIGVLEDPNQSNIDPQLSKAHELNNGNNQQKHQALPIQSATRGRSNIQSLSDAQNQTKMVSLNNKVCLSKVSLYIITKLAKSYSI